jgi:CRISPR-associated protein Cst2
MLLHLKGNKMGKVVQISILGKISGNVNADEVIGNRTTLKRMYSSTGEVLPFVSARAIKFAIRQAMLSRGLPIDPLNEDPTATEVLRLADIGEPDKYVDDDLFGYMLTKGRSGTELGRSFRRHAPVAISYFKALHDTPIKSEFAAKFPRIGDKENNPVPFEVEVAEFIGRLNIVIYDYIGDFSKSTTLKDDVKRRLKEDLILDKAERVKRLSEFLDIVLTPSYVLPRRTNSLSIPEYLVALICMSKKGPLPIYQYLDFKYENQLLLDSSLLESLTNRPDIASKVEGGEARLYLIDYHQMAENKIFQQNTVIRTDIKKVISEACEFLFGR